MTRYDRRTRWLAAGLSALAGYVDAAGFVASGGFFISFMSGNSTRLSVGIAQTSLATLIAGALISAFVLGAAGGSLMGRSAARFRRTAILALVTCLIGAAAACFAHAAVRLGLIFAAAAMGAENAVFEEDGEIRIGLTYMTGTLAKVGQRIADAACGGPRLGWTPYLGQWLALVAGAIAGAASIGQFGAQSFWIAAVAAGVLCRMALAIEQR